MIAAFTPGRPIHARDRDAATTLIGAVPNHHAIGWTANGMTVWGCGGQQGRWTRRPALCGPGLRHTLLLATAQPATVGSNI